MVNGFGKRNKNLVVLDKPAKAVASVSAVDSAKVVDIKSKPTKKRVLDEVKGLNQEIALKAQALAIGIDEDAIKEEYNTHFKTDFDKLINPYAWFLEARIRRFLGIEDFERPNPEHPRIAEAHWKELVVDSGISPVIANLNFSSHNDLTPGEDPISFSLLNVYGSNNEHVCSDGKVDSATAGRYNNLIHGGWWVTGMSLAFNGLIFISETLKDWGQFKPNVPYIKFDGKPIKYESPKDKPNHILYLRVDPQTWLNIFLRYANTEEFQGLTLDYDYEKEPDKFWIWVAKNRIPVYICEGPKKAASLLSQGYAAISIPGITSAYFRDKGTELQDRTLHKDLDGLLSVTNRTFYFVFDAETKPKTKRDVDNAISRTGGLLVAKKQKVRVVTLPLPQKEIAAGKIGAKMGVDDFIVGGGNFDQLIHESMSLVEWRSASTRALTVYRDNSIILKPEDMVEINGKRYIPEDILDRVPAEARFIAVKAAMGSGKTNALAHVVKKAKLNGTPVLSLNHRNQLGEALAKRFDIYYLTETVGMPDILERAKYIGLGLCTDSMHKSSRIAFNPDDWKNCLVIIDECEQVGHHTLMSRTSVKDNRAEVLRNIGKTCYQAIKSGNRIYISDAHLTDISLDLIKGLTLEAAAAAGETYAELAKLEEQLTPYVVVTDEDEDRLLIRDCYFYPHTKPVKLFEDLVGHIQKYGRAFVTTDGQKEESTWGTKALEAMLRKSFPYKKILVIDSETTKDPNHPAFGIMPRINEEIVKWDIVITSPSAGTGISIDVKNYFNGVFGFFNGVITPEQVLQQSSRLRDDVPRYIWAAKVGLTRISGGATTIKGVQYHEDYKYDQAVLQLQAYGRYTTDEEGKLQMPGSNSALETYLKIAVRTNAGSAEFRANVLSNLQEEGYNIIEVEDLDPETKKELSALAKANRDEISALDSQRKADAEGCEEYVKVEDDGNGLKIAKITPERVKSLRDTNKIDTYQAGKLNISAGFATPLEEVTAEIIKAAKDGMLPEFLMHYRATVGEAYIPTQDVISAGKVINEKGISYKPDFSRSIVGQAVKKLKDIGILEFLKPENRFISSDDDKLAYFSMMLREENQFKLKATLGIQCFESESDVEIFKKCLKLVGYKLKALKRGGKKGARTTLFEIVDKYDPAFREITFKRWLYLDEQKKIKYGDKRLDYRNGKRIDDMDELIEIETQKQKPLPEPILPEAA